MNEKLIEQLQSYFDGEMTPEERLRMEAFIVGSPESRALLQRWAQHRRVFSGLKTSGTKEEMFVNQVMNQLETLETPAAPAEPAAA